MAVVSLSQPSILQFVPGSLPCPSHAAKKVARSDRDPKPFETRRAQRDLMAVRVVAVFLCRRAGIAHEEVVERAVLLNDEDDVLDGAFAGCRASPFDRACRAPRFAARASDSLSRCRRATGEWPPRATHASKRRACGVASNRHR